MLKLLKLYKLLNMNSYNPHIHYLVNTSFKTESSLVLCYLKLINM